MLREYIQQYDVIEFSIQNDHNVRIPDFPRTSMDIVFCFDGNIELSLSNQKKLKIDSASFIGNFDQPYDIGFSSHLSVLHVRFKVKGIYPLTKIPLEHLVNGQIPIRELVNQAADVIYHKMGECNNFPEKIAIFERFLIELYSNSEINYRLNHGIDLIQKAKGIISVKELTKELNTNYKSLERWFKSKVGLTPKKFSSITRFKNILEDIELSSSPSWMDYVVDYEFHDHSHFIKSFEEFSGLTPERYWKTKTSV